MHRRYLTHARRDRRHVSLRILDWLVLAVLLLVATWAVVVLVRAV